MIKKEKNKKKFLGREIAAIAIGVILMASVGIVWIGGAIEGAPPVSTYVGSRGPDIPHLLNYQGVLTDSAGDPVLDGTYQMTFGIYDSATGGSLLWSETQTVQVSDGLFNVLLGTVNPIPADVFCDGTDRWIGMKVRDDPEMTPRQRFVSVAYAYAAECAQGIAPGHGLEIKDTDGNVVHQLNADGTSWHAGMETFDGGIRITGPHESPSWRTEITANGGEKTYDESGRLRCEKFPDGSQKNYYSDGTLEYERGADGSENFYYSDGTLECEKFADGSQKNYYSDGTLEYERGADGTEKTYYSDGTLECEKFAGGTEKNYYSDGTLKSEKGADGSQKNYYSDGTLEYERGADGSENFYYEDGTLACEKFADGSQKTYYSDGTLKSEKGADGSQKNYYSDGTLEYERGADGSEKWYDKNGNLKCEVKANGDSSQTGTHTVHKEGDGYTQIGSYGILTSDKDQMTTSCLDSGTGDWWTMGMKNAVVETENYGNRTTYCEEAAEVYFFDRGESQLDNGEVTIELDPIFLETVTINATYPMLVQVTLTGDCNGVYVAQRTTSNFTVRELNGGNSNAGFMWEVAAKRKGYEDTRLEEWSE